MACSFVLSDDENLEKSFAECLLAHHQSSNIEQQLAYEQQQQLQALQDSKVIQLTRGGCIIKTSIGNIQYGIPPETIKDSMSLKMDVPTNFIVPSQRFNSGTNLSVAEFEFPAYFNFFVLKQKINLICDSSCRQAIRNAFQETLCGPENHDRLKDDFHQSYPKSGYPDFQKERAIVSGAIQDPVLLTNVDSLLSFSIFDTLGVVELRKQSGSKENVVRIEKSTGHDSHVACMIKVFDNGQEIAHFPDEVSALGTYSLGVSESSFAEFERLQLENLPPSSSQFDPPDFGVTILGSSHGFDPCGHTTGFVLWCNGSGIMVDPPPFSNSYLKSMGINPAKISAIIITHCHADHDAGAIEKILFEKKIEVITTRTIMNSFLRKYSNLTGMHREELRKLFVFRPVVIGCKMQILGGAFEFFYSFHVIPCIGFSVEFGQKSLYFSADTFYHPAKLRQFQEWGFLQQERYQQLANVNFDKYDLILHEAGVPPIHTPQEAFQNFSAKAKQNLYLLHVAKKDVRKDLGLKIAKARVEHTLVLIPANYSPELSFLKRLDLLSSIDIFEPLTIKNIRSLVECLEHIEIKKGDIIFPENSYGNKFYIIESGLVKIVSQRDKNFKSLIGVGDYFGEVGLIDSSHTRQASAFAETDCVLLTLERHDFQFLFGDEDGQGEVLRRLKELTEARKKFAIVYLEKNSLFRQLQKAQKVTLEAIVKECSFKAGESIWKKNWRPSSVYILKSGECMFQNSHNAEIKIEQSGEFIGETVNILRKQPVTSSLTAITDSVLLSIETANWQEFLDKNPGFMLQVMDLEHFC